MGCAEGKQFASKVSAAVAEVDLPGHPDAGAILLSRDGESEGSVIIAHGGGNDRFFGLHYAVGKLLASNFAVLTAHLAGHGRGGRDLFTLDNARSRLDALVSAARSRESGRIVVLGQSLGASLALDQLARESAGDAVVAVSAPTDLRTGMRLGLELGCLLRPSVYRAVRFAGPWRSLPAYRGFRRKAFPVRTGKGEEYLAAFAGAVDAMALPDRLRTLESPAPVLLVQGERDGVVPCSQARSLAESLGNVAQLNMEPGVHHLDPLLNRRGVQRILDWLQRLSIG